QLQTWGYLPVIIGSGEEALALTGHPRFAFALIAIRLPDISGLEVLRRLRDVAACGPVIMVADNGHSAEIVEAIQLGADDFVRRPYTAEDLENAIKAVAGRVRAQAGAPPVPENGERLRAELDLLVSPPMREILGVIEQAARAPARRARLPHVLQDGEFSRVGGRGDLKVDGRVIVATNRDLAREVAAGRFREDLFYRLNVINILVPPLRERREEIQGLVRYFVERYSRLFNFPERELSPEAMQACLGYHWPGNIRELENFVKRMI